MSPASLPPTAWVEVQPAERYRSSPTIGLTSTILFGTSAQLVPVMAIDTAPVWLTEALDELRALKEAGKDLPALGDFRISDQTADHARKLLTLESIGKLSAPSIVPFSGGGLSFNWSQKGRDLSLSVYSDQEVTFTRTTESDEVEEDGSVKQDIELAKVVTRFLASIA
jgi:hypothetical protein